MTRGPALLDCCLSVRTAPAQRPLEPFEAWGMKQLDPERRASRALANRQILAGCAKADPNAAEPWLHSPRQGAVDSDLSNSVIRLTISTLYTRLTTRIARALSIYLVFI